MEHLVQPTLAFIAAHADWAVAIMFVTAFGESFAFLSLLFPGTSLLIAAGALMAAGTLPYLPVLVGAILGAVLGDSVSYWIGRRFGGGDRPGVAVHAQPRTAAERHPVFRRHGGRASSSAAFSARCAR